MSRLRAGVALSALIFLPAVAFASSGHEVTHHEATSHEAPTESHVEKVAHETTEHPEPTLQHKALAAGLARFVDLPAGCFAKQEYPCALRIVERGELGLASAKLQATPEAELRMASPHEIMILSGAWWLRDTENLTVKFGEIRLELAGDALIERGREGLQVMNLNGQMKVKNGETETSAVPTGFQSLVAGLDKDAKLVQRDVRASDPAVMMSRLLRIAGAGYADVVVKAPEYRELSKKAVEEAAQLYRATLQARKLASEAEEAKATAKKAAAQAERQKFRTMFRDRFFKED